LIASDFLDARQKDEITLRQGVRVVKKIGMSEAARGAM